MRLIARNGKLACALLTVILGMALRATTFLSQRAVT